jgi:hypothetical protein
MHPYTIAKKIRLKEGYNQIHCISEVSKINCFVMVYGDAFAEKDELMVENLTALVIRDEMEIKTNIDEKEIIKHLKQKWQQQSQLQQS